MASRILEEYSREVESFELIPDAGGCFELTLDGQLVYSKLKTGQFPDQAAMVAEVGKRLK